MSLLRKYLISQLEEYMSFADSNSDLFLRFNRNNFSALERMNIMGWQDSHDLNSEIENVSAGVTDYGSTLIRGRIVEVGRSRDLPKKDYYPLGPGGKMISYEDWSQLHPRAPEKLDELPFVPLDHTYWHMVRYVHLRFSYQAAQKVLTYLENFDPLK